MKTTRNVQSTLVLLISITNCFINCEEDIGDDHIRDSEIDKKVSEWKEIGHTTLCYEDIPPLSIDVDGAPEVGPVIYGSETFFEKTDENPLDDEVKKLREEFFKKHKTNGPHQTPEKSKDKEEPKNEGNSGDSGIQTDFRESVSGSFPVDEEVKKRREEFFKKHKKNETQQMKNNRKHHIEPKLDKLQAMKEKLQRSVGQLYEKLNDANDLMKRDFNNINEVNLNKEDKNAKQHWNVDQIDRVEENKLRQHWNREPVKEQHNQKEWIPFEQDGGHKNDDFQEKIHEEIYGDTGVMDTEKKHLKNNIINEKRNKEHGKMQMNLRRFQDEENEIRLNVNKVNNLRLQLSNLLDLGKNNIKAHEKIMNIELQETTNPYQRDRPEGPACKFKEVINYFVYFYL